MSGKFIFVLGVFGLECALPNFTTMCDCRYLTGGTGFVSGGVFGRDLNGLDHEGFSVGGLVDDLSLRLRRVIICKLGGVFFAGIGDFMS